MTDGEMTPRAVERDKENQSYGSWLQIHRPSFQATTPMRDMVNVTYHRQPLSQANREPEKERDKDKGKRSRKLRRMFLPHTLFVVTAIFTAATQPLHWTSETRATVRALVPLSSLPHLARPGASLKAGLPTCSTGKASRTLYTHSRTSLLQGKK